MPFSNTIFSDVQNRGDADQVIVVFQLHFHDIRTHGDFFRLSPLPSVREAPCLTESRSFPLPCPSSPADRARYTAGRLSLPKINAERLRWPCFSIVFRRIYRYRQRRWRTNLWWREIFALWSVIQFSTDLQLHTAKIMHSEVIALSIEIQFSKKLQLNVTGDNMAYAFLQQYARGESNSI